MTIFNYVPKANVDIPHDLDGETALDLADLFYQLADEILRLNYGAIRARDDHIAQMRLQSPLSPQLSFPWKDHFHDLPF